MSFNVPQVLKKRLNINKNYQFNETLNSMKMGHHKL